MVGLDGVAGRPVEGLLSGDGPSARAFNEDDEPARESLSRLEGVAADTVVVGHGDPFEGAPSEAIEAVRAISD